MDITASLNFQRNRHDRDRASQAIDMFARWHGPEHLSGKDDKGRNANPGRRALNTLLDNSAVSNLMVDGLAAYVNDLETWAHEDIAEFTPFIDGPDPIETGIGDLREMAKVIVETRRECLADIAEFRTEVLGPMIAACRHAGVPTSAPERTLIDA